MLFLPSRVSRVVVEQAKLHFLHLAWLAGERSHFTRSLLCDLRLQALIERLHTFPSQSPTNTVKGCVDYVDGYE